MTCYYCTINRYDLCKDIYIHKLRNSTILDIVNDELSYFSKDNLIYKNNLDEIEVFSEMLNDLALQYIHCEYFSQNVKDIMIEYAPKDFKNMFLDYCYETLINDNISETIEYNCYYMDDYNKKQIAYYMLATSFIINKLHIN